MGFVLNLRKKKLVPSEGAAIEPKSLTFTLKIDNEDHLQLFVSAEYVIDWQSNVASVMHKREHSSIEIEDFFLREIPIFKLCIFVSLKSVSWNMRSNRLKKEAYNTIFVEI